MSWKRIKERATWTTCQAVEPNGSRFDTVGVTAIVELDTALEPAGPKLPVLFTEAPEFPEDEEPTSFFESAVALEPGQARELAWSLLRLAEECKPEERVFNAYLAMMNGLFAMRSVTSPSQETEAKIAELHADAWRQLSPADHERLEVVCEQLKQRWRPLGEPGVPMPVDPSEEPTRVELGDRRTAAFVVVDAAEPDPNTRVVDALPDTCSECGGDELYQGFGLAGGGMGSYAVCEKCDVIFKVMIPEDEA